MVHFTDIDEASERLGDKLNALDIKNTILLGISPVGVMIADKISSILKTPFDFLLNENILAPLNSECEIAVVSESRDIVSVDHLIESFDISWDYVYGEAKRKYEEEIAALRYLYRKGEPLSDIKDKNVILIDQGINTGLSMSVAVKTAITLGAKQIYVAAPVLAKVAKQTLEEISDGVYCVFSIEDFVSTEHYYLNNPKIDKDHIQHILEQSILKAKNQKKGNKWK